MIYFARAGDSDAVKIGWAIDVPSRIAELQMGNHLELRTLRTIEGAGSVERWLHRHFADRRIRGEWFRLDETMLTIEPPALAHQEREGRPEALRRAIVAAGGVAKLARQIGVTQQAVSLWRKVPAERCKAIVAATKWTVLHYELRPDIFPPEDYAPGCSHFHPPFAPPPGRAA